MYNKILCLVREKMFLLIRGVNQQVSLFCNNGTSETASDITFEFNSYLNLKPLHKKKLDQRFLEWFIGFTEGVGSFIILNNKVYFGITQNLDNIQVLYGIKKQLGFGKVLIRKESSPARLGSASQATNGQQSKGIFYVTPGPKGDNFHRLITIFNGNLCSKNKKEQFKIWLKTYNSQYDCNIQFIDRLVKPSLNTAWLSGFLDAEGCFTGRVKACHTYNLNKVPFLTFSVFKEEFYILSKIREILLSGPTIDTCLRLSSDLASSSIKNIKYCKSSNSWQFHSSSVVKLKPLRNYLLRYGLKTKKSLAFTQWCKIHQLVDNKEHLTVIGLEKIDLLTKKINNYNMFTN